MHVCLFLCTFSPFNMKIIELKVLIWEWGITQVRGGVVCGTETYVEWWIMFPCHEAAVYWLNNKRSMKAYFYGHCLACFLENNRHHFMTLLSLHVIYFVSPWTWMVDLDILLTVGHSHQSTKSILVWEVCCCPIAAYWKCVDFPTV